MPRIPAGITFWGAVGVVMTALHLNDRFGECKFHCDDKPSL